MTNSHLLIDGMNLLGAIPDGWWRDRDAAVRRLVDRLKRLAKTEEAITVVFDGEPLENLPEGEYEGVLVLFARRSGPNAADDRIFDLAQARPDDYSVITSDRDLQERLRKLGVEVHGVSALLQRLERCEPGSG